MKEIERRIRAARPLSGNRNLPLSDRAKRELAELIMDESGVQPTLEPSRARSRFRLSRPAVVSVAASVLALTVTVIWSLTPPPVYAATPPLLEFEPVEGTASELLLDLAALTCDVPWSDPTEPDGSVAIVDHYWALTMAEGEDGVVLPTVVTPEILTTTFNADGSVDVVAVEGEAYSGRIESDARARGEIIWQDSYLPGEFGLFGGSELPVSGAEMGEFFGAFYDKDVSQNGSDGILAIGDLVNDRRMSCDETAVLLEFLAAVPGIELAGGTVDRLGRDAIALSATRPPGVFEEYRDYLLIDPATGRILASETEYFGDSREDIESPSITSYIAWE